MRIEKDLSPQPPPGQHSTTGLEGGDNNVAGTEREREREDGGGENIDEILTLETAILLGPGGKWRGGMTERER